MLKSNFYKIVAAFAVMALMAPGLALANGGSGNAEARVNFDDRASVSSTNEFGVRILGERSDRGDRERSKDRSNSNNDEREHSNFKSKHSIEGRKDNGKHLGWFKDHNKDFKRNAFSGEVTVVSSTGFTFTAKDGSSLTVNTEDAKIVRLPNATLNSGISVGDRVHVIGEKTDSNIVATAVYDFAAHLHAAVAKGSVTAVSDDSITVQTDADSTITVNTNGDTKVVDAEGNATTLAEIDTNENVKLFGFWDSILNVFNAVKIRLF